MELASIHTPVTAFVAGLVVSLHCAGMCGPLACWLAPGAAEEDRLIAYSTYQGARLFSYGVLGAIAGGLGGIPLGWLDRSVLRYAPWAFVLFFVAIAFKWDKRLPRPVAFVRLGFALRGALRGRGRLPAAALLGLGTPLLPCGPLYFLLALAGLSGSALRGVEFMVAFGLGTLPLLWIVQANFSWLSARLSAATIARTQGCLALVAALVITWRLRATFGFAGPSLSSWVCF